MPEDTMNTAFSTADSSPFQSDEKNAYNEPLPREQAEKFENQALPQSETAPAARKTRVRYKSANIVSAMENILRNASGPLSADEIMVKLNENGMMVGKRLIYQYLSQFSRNGKSLITRVSHGSYSVTASNAAEASSVTA